LSTTILSTTIHDFATSRNPWIFESDILFRFRSDFLDRPDWSTFRLCAAL
jgi:hypothetical protein